MRPVVEALRRVALSLLVKPLARLLLGLNVIGRDNLPAAGPAIIAANHNSHVDTLVLLSVFPSRMLKILRPVAAADHFLRDPVSSWFSRVIVGIIPLQRGGAAKGEDVLAEAKAALSQGQILIVFPEGTRGEPEEMGAFKAGVARLVEAHPQARVHPVYIQGAGRALPRDAKLFVPFDVTIVAGEPLEWTGSRPELARNLRARIEVLKALAPPMRWE